MKILVIQTAFTGDVILATALLEQLQKINENNEISILVRKGNESLFEGHPFIKNVFIWDKKKKYKSLWSVYRILKKTKWDQVINLQRFGSTGLLTWKLKAKTKVGFQKNPYAFSYDIKVPHKIESGIHEIERNSALIEHMSKEIPLCDPKLYPKDTDIEQIKPYIQAPFITMAPASVWFTKQLPIQKWVELINQQNSSLKIYLIGAPGDKALCNEIIKQAEHPKVENLCGKTQLLASAALMKNAQMNYVNDSAPMHIASSVNAPVTVFYCSTVPEFGFGPLSSEQKIIETEVKLECRPCGLHGFKKCPKGHFKCATTIDISKT